jgi:uncharacterized protein (TIGR02421 family)
VDTALPKEKPSKELARFTELDRRLVAAAKPIKILTTLTWDEDRAEAFVKSWRAGKPKLPKIDYPTPDHGENVRELEKIMAETDREHPVGNYIYQTAEAYVTAAKLLAAVETARFTELSIQLYGKPSDSIGPNQLSSLQAADHFIEGTRDFVAAYNVNDAEYCITAEQAAESLRNELVPFFKHHKIEIQVDPKLASKAAAGPKRVRLRAATCFSALDIPQLIHHEGYVHMLTGLNGLAQDNLPSLGLGSPRTTATQEGIATFAELYTSSIDLSRLERIALRIHGIQMALDGADFIEVFKYFLAAGQTDQESFQSAARIFRGGDPKGKIAFTKDCVYLRGLIFTHTFLRKSIQENKFHYAEHLFAGRFTLSDIVQLEPFFGTGFIEPPLYEPPWLQNRKCLAAYLSYSVFANRINLANITLADF